MFSPCTCLLLYERSSGITPPNTRRDHLVLNLADRAIEKNHMLHSTIIEHPNRRLRLKSRKPLWIHTQNLRSTDNSDSKNWSQCQWAGRWQSAHSSLKDSRPLGHWLPRKLWTRLNRVRTGHGRFKHNMFKMGLRNSPACECGAAKQTAHHFRPTCPINRAPNNLSGEDLSDTAIHWWERIDI